VLFSVEKILLLPHTLAYHSVFLLCQVTSFKQGLLRFILYHLLLAILEFFSFFMLVVW